MSDHICPEPGCGMKMTAHEYLDRDSPNWEFKTIHRCPRNADAHALCARVAELEGLLKELFSIGDVFMSAIEGKEMTANFEAWAAKVPNELKEAPHDETV